VSVERVNARDADVESVEEPPPADRTPPPDTPGQAEGTSRADSRAGAAVANAAASEQRGATVEERRDEPHDEDPPDKEPPDEAPVEAPDKDPRDEEPPDEAPDEAPATDSVPSDDGADDVEEQDSTAVDPDDGAENASGSAETVTAPEETPVEEDEDEPRSVLVPVEDDAPIEDGPIEDAPVDDDAPVKAAPAKEPEVPGRAADTGERAAARPRDTPRLEPLTDREYAEHTAQVASSLDAAAKRGESTEIRHTLNPERTIWSPDRAELHQQIVDDLYAAAAEVPDDGQAIVAGGLGGAGKSTTLEGHAGIDRMDYLTINPDDIKETLAKRGMLPPVEGLDPMERSALVHEESSQIARLLADRAYADRKNLIWDITMSSRSSTARRIQQLREAGYRTIEGVFVDIPVPTSVDRAQVRHRQGMEDHRNGEGLGGRYVPPDVIQANADAEWESVNRGVFEELKPRFDQWKLYDNSVDGRGPVLLESSDGAGRDDDE
jgi:hypothetical protein